MLVVIHGLGETSHDLEPVRSAAADFGGFSDVKSVDYDSVHDVVPDVGKRVYQELDQTYPSDTNFVLYGYSKGGLIADWIAQRVKASEGRVARVITVDSPLDGAQNLSNFYEILKDATGRALDPFADPNSSTTLERALPGIDELRTGSATTDELKSPPLCRQNTVEYIRVYAQGDSVVESSSALRRPPGAAAKFERVLIRTSTSGSVHQAMRDFLAKHPRLLRRILENQLPREAEFGPLEFADDSVTDKSGIPAGWVPCTCPGAHAGLGVWFEGTMYHNPAFHCPQ